MTPLNERPTPTEQNIEIAEIAGIVSKDQHGKLYHTEKGYVRDCPNYHGSLDAIVPVVRAMIFSRRHAVFAQLREIQKFQSGLYPAPNGLLLSTAAQWCEAVLREAGLWK